MRENLGFRRTPRTVTMSTASGMPAPTAAPTRNQTSSTTSSESPPAPLKSRASNAENWMIQPMSSPTGMKIAAMTPPARPGVNDGAASRPGSDCCRTSLTVRPSLLTCSHHSRADAAARIGPEHGALERPRHTCAPMHSDRYAQKQEACQDPDLDVY